MIKRIIIVGFVMFVFFIGINFWSGSFSKEPSADSAKPEPVAYTAPAMEVISSTPTNAQFKAEINRVPGGTFVTESSYEDGKAEIMLDYNYQEYKKLHPDSNLDKATYESYFNSDKSIIKSLNGMAAKLFGKFDELYKLDYAIKIKGSTYRIKLSKVDFETFIGYTMEAARKDYTTIAVDPVVYDEAGREQFFKRFGSIR